MKKIYLYILVALVGVASGISFMPRSVSPVYAGDPSMSSDSTTQQQQEQTEVASKVNSLINSVPLPNLESSLERKNISRRLELFSDENKVSYIYLISFGRVMAFYTVQGKITSGNKRLTSTERLVGCDTGEWNGECLIESPELDGTYGSSSQYIFFWTTDGAYVQWNGEYMLSDFPLKLTTQPELVRQIK